MMTSPEKAAPDDSERGDESSASGLLEIRRVRGRLRSLAIAAFAAFVLLMAGLAYVVHTAATQDLGPKHPSPQANPRGSGRIGAAIP